MSYEQQVWNAWNAGVIFTIVAVVFFVLSHRTEDGGPTLLARGIVMFRAWQESRRAGSVQNEAKIARSNLEPEPEPEANPASGRRTDERTGAFALNPDQQFAVTKMIYHKTANPSATKATTIKAGFGVSKGESSRYKEASAIYDALFVLRAPDKYPQITPEQRHVRELLRLDKH